MLANVWNNILEWFGEHSERNKLVRDFNKSACNAFTSGKAPTMMKASVSFGCKEYRHQFSSWINTGFRIQALCGKSLSKEEIIHIGNVILNDTILVRKLIALGWDTLEVHDDISTYGCRWKLVDYAKLGGALNERN